MAVVGKSTRGDGGDDEVYARRVEQPEQHRGILVTGRDEAENLDRQEGDAPLSPGELLHVLRLEQTRRDRLRILGEPTGQGDAHEPRQLLQRALSCECTVEQQPIRRAVFAGVNREAEEHRRPHDG